MKYPGYVVREGRRYTVALRNHWVWLHYTILARPSRGGPVILLERLRWDTLLLWLLHVSEEAFGQRTSPSPKGACNMSLRCRRPADQFWNYGG